MKFFKGTINFITTLADIAFGPDESREDVKDEAEQGLNEIREGIASDTTFTEDERKDLLEIFDNIVNEKKKEHGED